MLLFTLVCRVFRGSDACRLEYVEFSEQVASYLDQEPETFLIMVQGMKQEKQHSNESFGTWYQPAKDINLYFDHTVILRGEKC